MPVPLVLQVHQVHLEQVLQLVVQLQQHGPVRMVLQVILALLVIQVRQVQVQLLVAQEVQLQQHGRVKMV
jgi:hypothetical protein